MKQFKLSLKEKAILGIIAILIPILIAFILVYRQNREHLKNRILDTLTIIAEAYEGQVYQFLEMSKRRAQDFASDGFIRTQLQKAIHGNTSAMNKLSRHLIKNKLTLDKTINTINVLSLEGRVIASTNNAEIGRDLSSETIFLKGKETVTIIEKCFGHCKFTEIAISAPISNKDTGRLEVHGSLPQEMDKEEVRQGQTPQEPHPVAPVMQPQTSEAVKEDKADEPEALTQKD